MPLTSVSVKNCSRQRSDGLRIPQSRKCLHLPKTTVELEGKRVNIIVVMFRDLEIDDYCIRGNSTKGENLAWLIWNKSSKLLSAIVLTNYTHSWSSLLTCLHVVFHLRVTIYRHDVGSFRGRGHASFTLACQGLLTSATSKRKRTIFLRHLHKVTCRTGELRIKCLRVSVTVSMVTTFGTRTSSMSRIQSS